MKLSLYFVFFLSVISLFSCRQNTSHVTFIPENQRDTCENKTAEACWQWAQTLEENGDPNMLQVLERACTKGSHAACNRFIDEAELTLFPSPGQTTEAWETRLESLCFRGEKRACQLLDVLQFFKPNPEPKQMKKAFFNRLEVCRKEASQCVKLMQAIIAIEHKQKAFFKSNAFVALQAACEGGVAEACHHEALIQTDKRDLRWTFPLLLRACMLGETAGCNKLVQLSFRAIVENITHYMEAESFLKQACFEVEFRKACIAWARGHIKKIWVHANPQAGRDEFLRQCRYGDNESCTEFARFLLRYEPHQRSWALQILRQTCADSYQNACVEWIATMEKGSPEEQHNALLQARFSCLKTFDSSVPHEYEYDRNYNVSFYNNPSCVLYARMIVNGKEIGVSGKSIKTLFSQACSNLAHPVCLYYGQQLMQEASTKATDLISLYERICKDGHAEACLEMATLQRRGFKELKPNEAVAREYTSLACRLDPQIAVCTSNQ